MKTGEKIRYLRKRKGLSQEDLGTLVGVKKAAINKYETGRVVNIKRTVLLDLAKALDVSAADLLDDPTEAANINRVSESIKKLRTKYDLTQSELGIIAGVSDKAVSTWENGTAEPRMGAVQRIADHFMISKTEVIEGIPSPTLPLVLPVLGSVPAGIPLEAIEDIVDYEEIPSKCANSDKEFFALKVKGDSMSPKYLEGDTIILERCEDVESGTDAVVYVNGYDATLKKVIKKSDCIILQPINPVYDPIVIDYGRDGDPVRIVGRVIELRRKF